MSSDRLHILIVGCGGREHAIAKALHRSKFNPRLFCFGTYRNPGILALVSAYATAKSITDINAILEFSSNVNIDFAIVGPEAPLQKGIADELDKIGIPCIGPYQGLARLETSKEYARKLLHKYGLSRFSPVWKSWNISANNRPIPQRDPKSPLNKIMTEVHYQELKSRNFSSIEPEIREFVSQLDGKFVIKADGLKGGKGVKVSGDHFTTSEQGIEMCKRLYNDKETFLIEERLQGEEFSLFSFCDGKNFIHCPIVKDYKRAKEGNSGPNTGGMGSFSMQNHRLPFLSAELVSQAQQINETVVRGLMMENGGTPYIGIVYGGFMKLNTEDTQDTLEPSLRVVEYNVRFGDPEGINILELMETDFVKVCIDMLNENLSQSTVKFKHIDTKCVYIVPKGYPVNRRPNFVVSTDLLNNIIRQDDVNVELIVSGINHTRDTRDTGNTGNNNHSAHTGNVYIEEVKTLGSGELTCGTLNIQKLEKPKIHTVDQVIESQSPHSPRSPHASVPTSNQTGESAQSVEMFEVVVDPPPPSDPHLHPGLSGLMTTGSRTFALIGTGRRGIENLNRTLEMLKYQEDMVDRFSFRSDIAAGWMEDRSNRLSRKGIRTPHRTGHNSLYAKSGVNIETGNEAVESIQHFVKQTHTPAVLENDGGFGGMIRLPQHPLSELSGEADPLDWVLVNSTDSVGSKSIFVRRWWGKTRGMESLGHDIVNHCVNDVLVQSPDVRPLTFLDYYATHTLDPTELKWFVKGVSDACRDTGCVLIGGETAEIPGIYREGCHDLVGAITAIVQEEKILRPKRTIQAGDVVYGIPSDSPHTNGFTLIQHLVKRSKEDGDMSFLRYVDDWAKPHRCYLRDIRKLRDSGVQIKGLCHITGGGFIDNPHRILADTLDIEFDWNCIHSRMPDWMKWLKNKMKQIDPDFEMRDVHRTFNCGVGMLIVVSPDQTEIVSNNHSEMFIVGKVVEKKEEDPFVQLDRIV